MNRDAAGYMTTVLAVCLTLYCLGQCTACTTLSPKAKTQIAKDQVELAVCGANAHDCKESDAGPAKCWAVFDDCMIRHGFYDGGADAR